MRERLRLLLTAAAVSAAAVVLAVWVNGPAEVAPRAGGDAGEPAATVPEPGEAFVSPVEDGVFPSAVISEDMRRALEQRAADAPATPSAPAGGAADPEAPREIGEFMDPDAPLTASTAAPRSIGEFLDPEAMPAETGTGERMSIGRFLDPDRPDAAAAAGRPVAIGRPIDPDRVAMQPPAAEPNRIEIGEYMEVDAP